MNHRRHMKDPPNNRGYQLDGNDGRRHNYPHSDSHHNRNNNTNRPSSSAGWSNNAQPNTNFNRQEVTANGQQRHNHKNKKKNKKGKSPGGKNSNASTVATSAEVNRTQQQRQSGGHHTNSNNKKKKRGRDNHDIGGNNQENQQKPTKRSRTTSSTHGDDNNRTKSGRTSSPASNIVVKMEQSNVIDLADSDDEDNENSNSNAVAQPSNLMGGDGTATPTNETHVIFAIDFSRSMRNCDVRKKNEDGEIVHITRWDAVFECIDGFLSDQLSAQQEQQQQGHDEDGPVNSNKSASSASLAVVSVVIFNEHPMTLLERMPLVGNGEKVRKALHTARKAHVPKKGTSFSAGFQITEQLVNGGDGKRNKKNAANNKNNVVVVFLSDGRPGDLKLLPPKNEFTPMQETFSRDKKKYPAAGYYIEKMRARYKNNHNNGSNNRGDDDDGGGDSSDDASRLNLNFVCLYEEGRKVNIFLLNGPIFADQANRRVPIIFRDAVSVA